jgi:DNA-binding response OmpR family regulator
MSRARPQAAASVLIVEGSLDLGRLLERVARQQARGVAVVACATSAEAKPLLEAAAEPVLLLVDGDAEAGDALAQAGAWRARHADSRLVATVLEVSDDARLRAREAGADEVVEKPARLDEWRTLIAERL